MFDNLTNKELGDLRVAISEAALEIECITGKTTTEARNAILTGSALNELTAWRRCGLSLSRAKELGKADAEGRVVVIHPNQRPSLSFGVRPSCWYADKPNGYFCLGFCHGDIDDEPIDACKRCTWLDGNEDLREEAEAALAKMKEKNNEQA